MKKIIVVLLFIFLAGCSKQVSKDCLDSFCVDSYKYGIEGTLSVQETNRGSVTFDWLLIDDENQLRNVTIDVYSSEWDFISEMSIQDIYSTSGKVLVRALQPTTDYIAVMMGTIVVDGEFLNIVIANLEFTTDTFLPVDITGSIDNVRVGSSFVIYDYQILSNDYTIVTYGVFLYDGDTKIDEHTLWGSRELTVKTNNDQVFSNLSSNTTYTLKLSVIYELETMQNGQIIDEFTFITD